MHKGFKRAVKAWVYVTLGFIYVPIITIIGSQFSILMGGTVVTESIFAFNGTGNFTVSCIRNFEQIAATTSIIMTCIFTAVVLLCVDIVYAFVDPRVKARYTKK